jgi:very-short-patch-repair endonuclease
VDPERLGGERDIAHLLHAPRLGRERKRVTQQFSAVADRSNEREARRQDTDDHENTCSHKRPTLSRSEGVKPGAPRALAEVRENPLHTKKMSHLIAGQLGHITRRQLLAAGVRPAWVERHTAGGELIAVHAGVYAVGHAPRHAYARACAAVLACGVDAALSHSAAAALWGVADWPSTLEVIAPREHRRPGIHTHRSRTLSPRDLRTHHGVRTTAPVRTVIDIQSRLTDARLSRIVNDLRVAGHIGPTAFAELCTESPRVGRLLGDADGYSASVLEDRFRAFLIAYDLPTPAFNARLRESGREVDALYRDARLIIELDSWTHHHNRSSFERDRDLDERAMDDLYTTVRVTGRRLSDKAKAQTTAERIRRILARSSKR